VFGFERNATLPGGGLGFREGNDPDQSVIETPGRGRRLQDGWEGSTAVPGNARGVVPRYERVRYRGFFRRAQGCCRNGRAKSMAFHARVGCRVQHDRPLDGIHVPDAAVVRDFAASRICGTVVFRASQCGKE